MNLKQVPGSSSLEGYFETIEEAYDKALLSPLIMISIYSAYSGIMTIHIYAPDISSNLSGLLYRYLRNQWRKNLEKQLKLRMRSGQKYQTKIITHYEYLKQYFLRQPVMNALLTSKDQARATVLTA